jgi:TolC family type I secretion outer membrane protein
MRLFESYVIGTMLALAIAQPARAQTLNQALANAYLNNPTLRAAQVELRRVDEQVPQARAGWRPQAEVTAGGGGALSQGGSQRTNLSGREGPVAALDLRVRQPIYNFGTRASIEEAENSVKAERARLTAAEQDTLLHAAAAYTDVLRAQDVLDLNRKHEQLIQQDLESARRRSSAGELAKSDVPQSEAGLARATAERIRAEAELSTAREAYRVWMRDGPGTLIEPELPPNLPATQEEVESQSSASPNVIAGDFAVKEARNAVDVSRGQKLPQVFLQGDVEPSSQSILALLSVPLYNGTLDPQIRAAKELAEQRRLEADAQRQSARQAAIATWQKLVAARAQIAAYQAQVRAAEAAEESVSHAQALGLRSIEDLLTARDRLRDARVSLTGARRDAFQAAFEVLASIGHLTARDLGLDVPYYDPERHYDEVRAKWWGTKADN